jgi:hypothetical protein
MKVTSEVIDIFPPETEVTGDGTLVDVDCPLDALCSQVFERKCEIVFLKPAYHGTYEVAVSGEEADVRAYLEEVGWGTDAGYVWELDGDKLVHTEGQ